MEYNKYEVGDIVRTKKQHPCGSKLWEVTRIGVDFKLKCQGCGHRNNDQKRRNPERSLKLK